MRIFISVTALLVFFGIAALGWGDFTLFSHPARTGLFLITFSLMIVSFFAPTDFFAKGKREDMKNRWIFSPLIALTILMAWLPSWTDRRSVLTLDGDAIRYTGVALALVGGILRLIPVFILGRRFTVFVAIQKEHELAVSGIYGIVRHPSYLGALIYITGWALTFRSAVGLIITAFFVPIILARILAEERLLLEEFGDAYQAYQRQTWRLIPYLY